MTSFTEKTNFIARGYIQFFYLILKKLAKTKQRGSWQGTEVNPALPIA
jgi:hypothetical protein